MQREALIERLEAVPGLVAAYLFGSQARGDARPGSDVDIAILLAEAPRTFSAYPFELADELSQSAAARVDVVVLNRASADLVHRVLRDGQVLIDRDRRARIAFEVRAHNEYFDMLPIWKQYRQARRGV